MHRRGRLLVVAMLVFMLANTFPITIAYKNSEKYNVSENSSVSSIEPVHIDVSMNGEITKITCILNDFSTSEITINGEKYLKITVPGESNILEKGKPDLPRICRSVIIPDDAKMGLKIPSVNFRDIYNVSIAPSKGNLIRNVNPDDIPYEFDNIYNEDMWYPGKLAKLRDPYILRDFRAQVVEIYPFQYNPYRRILRVYTEIELEVLPVAPGKIDVLDRKKPLTSIDEEFKQIYRREFINFDRIDYRGINFAFPEYSGCKYTPVDDHGNMLIICYDDFYDEMQPFVEWKNMKGVPTEIVNLSEVGSTADDIYDYIVNYYNTRGLTLVLLVGDAEQVPTMMVGGHASDPSYSYIVGDDHYPDIFVGRFSAENTDHVVTQVERSVDYEKYPQANAEWYHKGTGIASNQGPGDDGEYDYQHIRNIRSDLLSYTYTTADELYDGSQGGADAPGNPSASMVSAVLNEGRGIVNYCGHGSQTSWGTTGFSNSDVNALEDDNKLPFIFSVACLNGQFVSGTCFAEAWLRATDDNTGEPTGAIATFMSSKTQAWSPPMDAQDEFVDILVESYQDNIKRTIGGLVFNGCMHMNDEYGSQGYAETDAWHLFGDPSLEVRTDTPESMAVIYNDTMPASATTFDVTVVGVEGALCALSRNGVLLGYDYTDSSGHATIELPEPVGESCILDLVVTAYNKIPYFGQVQVISVDFYWEPEYPNTGEPIHFYGVAEGSVSSWHWDFGDGETSDEQNPVHTYYAEGIYDVTLTITNSDGTFSITKPVQVKDNWEPVAIAHPEFYAGNNPTIHFDGSDSWDPDGTIVSYYWDFADGNTSTEVSLTHTYAQDGIYNVTLTVTDDKGAIGVAHCEIRVDAYTPPVTTAEVYGAMGYEGWYRGKSVKVRLMATDWSGVDYTMYRIDNGKWKTYDKPFRVWGEGYHLVEFYSVDIYGNIEGIKEVEIKIDDTPPSLKVEISGDRAGNWYTSSVTVTCNASDSLSGIHAVYYSLDGSRWEEYTEPIYIDEDGTYIFRAYAEDVAGNTYGGMNTYLIKIDREPPFTKCIIEGLGSEGDYYKNVTVTLIATDNGTGVNRTFYRLDGGEWNECTGQIIVDEIGSHTLEYHSTDNLGHEEKIHVVKFNITNFNFRLRIANPQNGLYIFGRQTFFIKKTIIIGGVTIEAELEPYDPDVPPEYDSVIFYIDGNKVKEFTSPPFEWSWEGSAFGRHTITVKAFHGEDTLSQSMEVIIFKLL